MKTYLQTLKNTAAWSFALVGALSLAQFCAVGAEDWDKGASHHAVIVPKSTNADVTVPTSGTTGSSIVIGAIEPFGAVERVGRKEMPWLGVSTEEAPEVLAAQLGLDPGVGLVVTWVATNSPAAKAGLQKNDVLVEFDGQSLVHPAQLRKLVQVRKEGDVVKLVFYRAGKKQTASATLGKTAAGFGWLDDEHLWQSSLGSLRGLQRWLPDMPTDDTLREQAKTLRESLGNLKIDQTKLKEEIRRNMEEARKAYREALRHATNANSTLGPILEGLAKSGVFVDNDASVTVRSSGKSAKSLVKTDESGTIVVVSNPKLHLTAHDKDGNLLFDGKIETPEQRAKVPRELWNKVGPLLEKMTRPAEGELETKPTTSPKETSSMRAGSFTAFCT